jgi:hypothetical protein
MMLFKITRKLRMTFLVCRIQQFIRDEFSCSSQNNGNHENVQADTIRLKPLKIKNWFGG